MRVPPLNRLANLKELRNVLALSNKSDLLVFFPKEIAHNNLQILTTRLMMIIVWNTHVGWQFVRLWLLWSLFGGCWGEFGLSRLIFGTFCGVMGREILKQYLLSIGCVGPIYQNHEEDLIKIRWFVAFETLRKTLRRRFFFDYAESAVLVKPLQGDKMVLIACRDILVGRWARNK